MSPSGRSQSALLRIRAALGPSKRRNRSSWARMAGDVVVDLLEGQHRPLGPLAAGVADHAGAAAHQHDGRAAEPLQPGERHDRDEVADVERVGGRVEADVAGDAGRPRRRSARPGVASWKKSRALSSSSSVDIGSAILADRAGGGPSWGASRSDFAAGLRAAGLLARERAPRPAVATARPTAALSAGGAAAGAARRRPGTPSRPGRPRSCARGWPRAGRRGPRRSAPRTPSSGSGSRRP